MNGLLHFKLPAFRRFSRGHADTPATEPLSAKLTEKSGHEAARAQAEDVLPKHVLLLLGPYTLKACWYELFEHLRKVLLVGFPVFLNQGSI